MSPPQGISTFLPFLVTGIFCFLEKLLFTKENHHSLVPEPSQLLSNAFRNYFSFIGIMVALRLVITPSKFGFNRKSNHMEPQNALFSLNNPLEAEPTNSSQIKQVIIHFCKLMISYTLLFGCFQFIFALAFHFPRNSPQDIINSSVSQPSSRYLDQITIPEDFIEPERLIPSPYLNPGEILGSINPGYLKDGPAYLELLISKDAKTLFTFNNFTLEVFDISNPKKPSKIGSLEDIGLLQAVLLLSPKEDFLYMLSWDRFWIINITDKTSPSKASSQIFEWRSFVNEIDFYFSMVISSDGITLWTVNNGRLRAWDVSDPKVPEEYFAEIPDRDYRGSLAISKDDKRLVIGLEEGFKIYNITTPRRAYMLKTVDTIGRVYSIAFSHDDTKLLLGVQNDINRGIRIFDFELVIFDIADLASPTLLLSHKLNREASYGKLWFHENEKYAFFNSKREFRMINILDGEQTTLFSTLSDLKGLPFTASPDNKINIVYISGMIHIMKFNIDITPGSFLHFKQNSLQVIDDMDFERRRVMEISKDGKNLFLVRMDTVIPSFGEMVPYERKSCATFEKLSPSSQLDAYINEQLRDDAQWIFAIGKNISVVTYVPNRGSSFFLINMTNKTKSYPFAQNKIYFSRIPAVALTNDEKSLVFVNHTNDIKSNTSTLRLNIVTWDVKTMRVTSSLTNFNMPFSLCYPFSVMKTNQDDSLLFYANCDLLIYNITNPSAPILEFSLSLNVSQTYSFILSKNEKILYLFGSDSSSSSRSKLLIFNISNPRSPQLLTLSQEIILLVDGNIKFNENLE